MANNLDEELVIRLRAELVNNLAELDHAKAKIQSMGKVTSKTVAEYNTAFDTAVKANKRLENSVAALQPRFAGFALSLLFAGQAMQRTFLTIGKFGVKVFDDISHSVAGTVTQNDILAGSMKYLGFLIGEALQPILEFLIPIIEAIADWVDQNQELTKDIIALGIALGTALSIGGALKLAKDGFAGLLSYAKNLSWKDISSSIQSGVGMVAIGYALVAAKEAYDEFKEGKVVTGMIDALSAGLTGIGGIRMIKGKGGGALIAIGVSLDLVSTGSFLKTLAQILSVMTALVDATGSTIRNILVRAFTDPLKSIIDGFIKGFQALGIKVPGILTTMSKTIGDIQNKFSMNPMDNFDTAYTKAINLLAPLAAKGDQKLTEGINYLDNRAVAANQGAMVNDMNKQGYIMIQNVNVNNPVDLAKLMMEIQRQAAVVAGNR